MTSSLSVVRQGSQLPSIEAFPPFFTTAADDAIDLAAIAGLFLDPWQQHILRGALGEKQNGKWSAFRVAAVLPRQNGKNALLEARELAGLFLFGEKRIIHTAHEVKTARESMQALMNRVKATPDLMEQVAGFDGDLDKEFTGMKTGNDPSITLKNGNKLSYAARSKGSGRGFTGDLIILDEAYALKSDEMAARVPTMAAKSIVGNPQLWFTSSAGMPESDLLAAIRDEGVKHSSNRLAYYEWSAPEDADVNDVDAWYASNPGLGIRISEQYVMDELETFISTGEVEKFKRERLGIWAPLASKSGAFPPVVWGRQFLNSPVKTLRRPAAAVDVITGMKQSAALVIAGDADGFDVVHVARHEPEASQQFVDEVAAVLEPRGIQTVSLDNFGENQPLIPLFEEAGFNVIALSREDMRQACTEFSSAVFDKRVWHRNQDPLNQAVVGSGQRGTDAGIIYSQTKSTSDQTPLRAAAVAWHVFRSGLAADYDVLDSVPDIY